ncbi:type II toxin-antitoxin system death-on-curing family toxin [Globicatella sulfidifaciens]
MTKINYITVNDLIFIHDNIVIKYSGGLPGIKDLGRLHSVLDHLQNDLYYPTFEEKLSNLVFSIIQFHMFIDGNKRTSIAASVEFLHRNHFSYLTDTYIEEMENIVVWVADGKIDKDLLTEILTSFLKYGELIPEARWKITKSLLKSDIK